MHRYRIINKFRFFTCFFLISMLVFIVLFTIIVDAKDNSETNLISVCIESGDTLWQLSNKYASRDMDIRDYINKVIEINQLKSVNIKPGQIINFPQY